MTYYSLLVSAAAVLVACLVWLIIAIVGEIIAQENRQKIQTNVELSVMTLRIFLDEKSFHCLKESVPAGSRCRSILTKAVHLKLFGNTTVLTCDESEARNLSIYASHCRGVIASMNAAFGSAGLPLMAPKLSVDSTSQRRNGNHESTS